MRKLLLIRHAKSSCKFTELDDHERPLNRRGERDVLTMARHLQQKDDIVDVIYSSTAVRALDFAQVISEFLAVPLEPDLSLYTFDVDELLAILQSMPEAAYCIAVVAHNPAIKQLVNRLTGVELVKLPTAGVVALNCTIEDWSDLGDHSSEIEYFDYPKMIV